MTSSATIAFIGAGNMATSLLGGLLNQGIAPSRLRASDPKPAHCEQLSATLGIACFEDNAAAAADADVVVLAVKPQVMKEVCLALAPHLPAQALVISIAAGISVGSLQQWLGQRPVVRCMPNTPSLLGQGVSGLFASAQVSTSQRSEAEALLSAVGLALWVETEQQLDAVTALSGSGPAYFFLLIEAMTEAGQQLGLSAETAAALAGQTALGAARMAVEGDVDARELRRRVTSPNGTTEAAIKTFLDGGLPELVGRAMQAAARRSEQMTTELGR